MVRFKNEGKITKIEYSAAQFNAGLCDKSANKLTNGYKFGRLSEILWLSGLDFFPTS